MRVGKDLLAIFQSDNDQICLNWMQQAQSLLLLPILILFSPPIVIVLVPFGHIAQLAIVDTIFQLTSLKDMKPTRLFKQLA